MTLKTILSHTAIASLLAKVSQSLILTCLHHSVNKAGCFRWLNSIPNNHFCHFLFFPTVPLPFCILFYQLSEKNKILQQHVNSDQNTYINKIQRDATVCRCLFTAKLLYMFRVSIAPIIRSSSNCNCSFWYRSQCQSSNLPPAWLKGHAGGRLLL